MSPQFVDFDRDGQLDIIAGIFDGSPHLARGSQKGFGAPEQIVDKNGERIVLNASWNFGTKKWDDTHRFDAPGTAPQGAHATSAVVFDVDGDGDLDLLLGDHKSGNVYVRHNEGGDGQPSFGIVNTLLHAGEKPIDVPGTVATLRLFDWDRDGRTDLLVGSMGDTDGSGDGGGVFLFRNEGSGAAATFASAVTLIPTSKKGAIDAPDRPDVGLYMDAGDVDGDGDADLVVGGYSSWTPKAKELTVEQQQRVVAIRAELELLNKQLEALNQAATKIPDGLSEYEKAKRYAAAYQVQKKERDAIQEARAPLDKELGELVPAALRRSFVWLYTNTTGP